MDIEGYKAHNEANRAIAKKLGASLNAANARIAELERDKFSLEIESRGRQGIVEALEARLREAEGDIEELTFCEDCAEDDTKLKENNCWPPRYCHSCRHKLVMEICELRKRAEQAEARVEALRAALEEVEYVPHAAEGMEGFFYCPWCGADDDAPHADDCARQAALSSEQPAE